jgi:mRNA-degrading endonuclease toxin of MazEF toxin-antitoxin module
VQSDAYNERVGNTIVAQITTTLQRAGDPANLLIDIASDEGQQSGLFTIR